MSHFVIHCKYSISKYGAKRLCYGHFAPELGQSGQTINKLKNLNMAKLKHKLANLV